MFGLAFAGLVAGVHALAVTDFETSIQPILDRYCVECHNDERPKAGLNLSHGSGLLAGSRDGAVVVPFRPQESLLLRLLREGKMPPEEVTTRPDPTDWKVLEDWVQGGAEVGDADVPETKVTSHDALPILHLRCVACHGRQKQEGGLDLRTPESIRAGGDGGAVVVPGDPESSAMIQKIVAGEMPPKRDLVKASVKPVQSNELDVLRAWIEGGLEQGDRSQGKAGPQLAMEARDFWSFVPPRLPEIPDTSESGSIRNPVDRFILNRLEAAGLTFSPEASREVLLRRASFDLRGLPPSQEEQEAFLEDVAPDAYERMIDRLLASPAYGERWGRFWLDLAGYSESEGMQHADELRPAAYRYRDYVIQSLNGDKSYRRFLTEQLAGDELVALGDREIVNEEEYDALVATGFLRLVPDGTNANITNFVPHRLDVIANEIQVLGSGLMGLTLHCARCHSHKFDPIPQRDYARLRAVFKGAFDEHDWLAPRDRRLEVGLEYQWVRWRRAYEGVSRRIERVRADEDLDEAAREKRVSELEAQRPSKPFVRALWDRGEPSETYLLTRGDYLNPADPVAPGVPEVLSDQSVQEQWPPPHPGRPTTGRRLAFARWLTGDAHPLTARVMVNRVWKHHFGEGIVSTLDNFGRAGALPSHPELLDWMVHRFVEQGWYLKSLHRLMMTSRTYRQRSLITPDRERLDPDNRLLSRMPLRRLEGELIRDTMLWTAGRMWDEPFGPSDEVDVSTEGLVMARPRDGGFRRSVYLRQRRTEVPTLLESFDLPAMSPNCVERSESTVATQALHLMNNTLIHQLAESFAQRLERERPGDLAAQVRLGFIIALGRDPTADEWATAQGMLEAAMEGPVPELGGSLLSTFCHALYNSAAFIYVD